MKIILSTKLCECGRIISRRTIDVEQFVQMSLFMSEPILRKFKHIRDEKCWKCKTSPKQGEWWGLSINHGEKNRVFCPKCSQFMQDELNKS